MKRKRPAPELSPLLEKLLCTRAGLGDGLHKNGKALQELAAAVQALSDGYLKAEQCDWKALYENPAAVRAYLLYYLPVNLVKLFPVLHEPVQAGAFDPLQRGHLSVLDLGCGPGTFLLGVLEYISRRMAHDNGNLQKITLAGIDSSADNLAAADDLIGQYCRLGGLSPDMPVHTSLSQGALHSPDFLKSCGLYDLILAGNVMAELRGEDLFACLARIAEHVAPGGALLIIDPGTCRAARRLLDMRDMLLENTDLKLFAPCLCVATCPLKDDAGQWCHEKLFWNPTEAVRAIDAALGFTKQKGIKYSFLSFVKHEFNRLSLYNGVPHEKIWRSASYVIRAKGEGRLWVCNGRERMLLRRLERNRSAANSDFDLAERGDLIFIDGAEPRGAFHDLPRGAVLTILRSNADAGCNPCRYT